MAKIILHPPVDKQKLLLQRPSSRKVDDKRILKIFSDVRKKGDAALRHYTRLFDKVTPERIKLNPSEIKKAEKEVPALLKQSIHKAYRAIRTFHEKTFIGKRISSVKTHPGITAWKKFVPLHTVGLYIPGGNAPLFSTVLMLGIPAQLSGCNKVVLCSPPSFSGKIHPAILFAARLCGIEEIYACGGVQAIAAMTLGTTVIPKVQKIFGPGNAWVTRAKWLAWSHFGVPMDMPAGPSEILVIADAFANPEWVAADLLSQCEHGPDSQAILLTTSEKLIREVKAAATHQLKKLPTGVFAKKSWKNSRLILLGSLQECVEWSNSYAPEHLHIHIQNYEKIAGEIINAGSVFLGKYCTESIGDYISGPNHTLPTSGFARSFSGISVESFMKTITFQQVSQSGLKHVAEHVIRMALAENLPAHAASVKIRINGKTI